MDSLTARVNAMTSNVNNALKCGPACQEHRKAKKLFDELQKAKQWKVEGPGTLYKTRKDYFVFTEGEQAYDARMMEKYTGEAARDTELELHTHAGRMEDISRGVKELSVGKQTLVGLRRLRKILLTEAKELSKAEKDALGKTQTNNARVALSVGADDTLQMVLTGVTAIYVIALLAYLWKGPFISGGQYNTVRGWLVPVLLIVFVYYSSTITTAAMRLYSTLLWLLKDNTPHDVYTDLDA